jgi:hypothetical protein
MSSAHAFCGGDERERWLLDVGVERRRRLDRDRALDDAATSARRTSRARRRSPLKTSIDSRANPLTPTECSG